MLKPTNKVLLTIKTDHPVWSEARSDAASSMLPFMLREIVAGNVPEAVVTFGEWGKLKAYLATLPSGKSASALAMAVADAPEPIKPEASERAVAARKLAEIIRAVGAASPFGADVYREESGRSYAVPFAYGSLVVGLVRVYSPAYVCVSYVAHTRELPPDGLPKIDTRVFDSVDHAGRFLTLALHQGKYREALAVPVRTPREKKGQQ